MYVCICKQISDNHVVEAWEAGHRDLEAIASETGLGSGCGSCRVYTKEMLQDLAATGSERSKD